MPCTTTPSGMESPHYTSPKDQKSTNASTTDEETSTASQDNKKTTIVIGGEQGPRQPTDADSWNPQIHCPSTRVMDTAISAVESNTAGNRQDNRDISASYDLRRWLSAFKDEYRHYWKGLVNRVEILANNDQAAITSYASIFSSITQYILTIEKKIEEHGTQLKKLLKQQFEDHKWAEYMFDQHNKKIKLAFSEIERLRKLLFKKDEENKKRMTKIDDQISSLLEKVAMRDREIAQLKAMLVQNRVNIQDVRQETEKATAESRTATRQKFEPMRLELDSLKELVKGQATQIDHLTQELIKTISLNTKLEKSHKSNMAFVTSRITTLEDKVAQMSSTIHNIRCGVLSALQSTENLDNKVSEYQSEMDKISQVCVVHGRYINNLRNIVNIKRQELEEIETLCE
ncbi:hypothetical protein DAKH74_024100 [Maudiozyma humilis]|uniref:Uncharacterized protein n=1 Tax=Maudiozyma humilis TaxID=51915 RepID=A0AAV5RW50_MAUHU|nr:hypothetical protein DAKH74_024100 [Kazachstania humilis]